MLKRELTETLYYDYPKDLPILDYHNHLSAKAIAENKLFKNITIAWLDGNHYKWKAMRVNSIEEAYLINKISLKEEFLKGVETVPYKLKNPLFH